MSLGTFNYTVDQSDSALAPSASSTPKPTDVVSVEALEVMFTDLAKQIGESISASLCISLAQFNLSLHTVSLAVMQVYHS